MNKTEQQITSELNELKYKMSYARSVEEWNLFREEAKSEFDGIIINRLDASGFINEILRKDGGHKFRAEHNNNKK